tara:strand:+ start:52 stop:681 length:630 start_codon:yes stop_codon:yes gene_type:complete
MAANNSIIKRTEYWLPEELWAEVKGYMGMTEEGKVRWDLIRTATLKHLLNSGLPSFETNFKHRKIRMVEKERGGYKAEVLIQSKNKKEYITPQETYLRRVKYLLITRGYMKPIKWRMLSMNVYKDLKPFDKVRVGTKFKIAPIEDPPHLPYWALNDWAAASVGLVTSKNKGELEIELLAECGGRFLGGPYAFRKGIFNKHFVVLHITKY